MTVAGVGPYLLAQVMEQNLLVPLNWLAGAKLLQYSHFSTEDRGGERTVKHIRGERQLQL